MLNIPPRAFPMLQTILTQQQNRTPLFEMAMGYVIAHHAALPTSAAADPSDHLVGAVNSQLVAQFLGTLSDFMPIRAFAIKAHAECFWQAKYDMVYGKAVPILCTDDGLKNLTRLGKYFTPENLEILSKSAVQLNNLILVGDMLYDSLREAQNRVPAVVEA